MRSVEDQHLMDQVRFKWQAFSGRSGEASALVALQAVLEELFRRLSGSNRQLAFDQAEFHLLIEIGEVSVQLSYDAVFCSVVGILHEAVVGEVRRHDDQLETGATLDLLCDYLDLLLVPLTLRQSALSEGALQCTCQRCFKATQAVHKLRESALLRSLAAEELTVLSFLLKALEHAGEICDRIDSVHLVRIVETLAVLGICARLQDNADFSLPPRAVQTIRASVPSDCWDSGRLSDVLAPTLLKGLHVLRNVASNRAQVLELSSETLGDTSHRISQALQTLTSEDSTQPRPKVIADRRGRRTQAAAGPASSLGLSADSPAEAVLSPRPAWTQPAPTPRMGDGGNPQESDDCTSGAEISSRKTLAERAGSTLADETLRPSRCAELLVLYSLALQAVAQSDEALQQAFLTEEAIRWQVVVVVRMLRTIEVLPKWRDMLAFHGIRLYVLVCRSSHTRQKYAVLQQAFVEEERRSVAFLLSLTPPAQRCCVLLRAMSQDVHSWLLWQTQAGEASLAPRLQPRSRRRSRRREALPATGTDPVSELASPSENQAGIAEDLFAASFEDALEENESCAKYLFTKGETVWLIHALLVAAFVACLVAMWHSVETLRPRGPSAARWSTGL